MVVAKQKGFLILLAIFIVTILSVFAVAVTTNYTYQSRSGTKGLHSGQALNVALGGLQRGLALYLADYTYCDGTTQSAEAFGDGEFKITCTAYNTNSITLGADISSTNTVIPVSTLTGLAPLGQFKVGGELVEYYETTSSAAQCNVETCGASACPAPCLLGAVRGKGTSTAASHSSGATIKQYQLVINSDGVVSTFSNILAERVVEEAFSLFNNDGPAGAAWAGGNDHEQLLQWTGGDWTSVVTPDIQAVNAIVCPSQTTCFAGGTDDQQLLEWDGTTWNEISTGDIDIVKTMACPSASRCFAGGTKDQKLLDWDGSTWTRINTTDIDDVEAMGCASATRCFAGGDKDGYLLDWDGSSWTRISTSDIDNVRVIHCPSATKCFAGGTKDRYLLEWDGSSWTRISTADIDDVRSMACATPTQCWAGGTKDGKLLQWDGSSWTRINTTDIGDVFALACGGPGLCWASGNDPYEMLEWDGISWSLVAVDEVTSAYAIATLPPATDVDTINGQGWHERFSEE